MNNYFNNFDNRNERVPQSPYFNDMYFNQNQNRMSRPNNMRPGYNNYRPENFDFIPVNSIDDVKNYYVEPGQKAWFRFQNDPFIALKISDGYNPCEMHFFNVNEVDPNDITKERTPQKEFVTVDYLNTRLKNMEDDILKLLSTENKANESTK